ncbi:MAG TPA: GNAT family N-acetyltransferase [Agriterribacter sp.]|nr:GNAT family N-acetyltransferase [Chitinophagaceae bacterium]HRP31589.1 GNAT family N-acetyltransferase [Agriterribacter sp.]
MDVTLRIWQKSDRDELTKLANNIKIWNNVRDRLPHPYRLPHAVAFIKFCRKLDPPHIFAIDAGGELAGCIGLELQEDISRVSAELGYWVGEPFWGQGVATDAVRLMIEYVLLRFPHLVRIYARVFDYNRASMRVLEKNGFHLESIQRRSALKNEKIIDEYVWVKFR